MKIKYYECVENMKYFHAFFLDEFDIPYKKYVSVDDNEDGDVYHLYEIDVNALEGSEQIKKINQIIMDNCLEYDLVFIKGKYSE